MSTHVTFNDLKPGDYVSVSLVGTLINAAAPVGSFTNAKVVGIVTADDFDYARTADAHANHVMFAPDFSGAFPEYENDYKLYPYVRLQIAQLPETPGYDPDAVEPVYVTVDVGLPWMLQATIVRISTRSVTVVISDYNEVSHDRLRAVLTAYGFTNVQIL